MNTDNFAHIINERKERYEAYAQWDREAAIFKRRVDNFMLFVFFPFAVLVLGSCFYSTFFK